MSENYHIMKSTVKQLSDIVLSALQRFDNYTQQSGDMKKPEMADYFNDSYNSLEEKWFKNVKNRKYVRIAVRNSMRMLIKETEKMASVTFINN